MQSQRERRDTALASAGFHKVRHDAATCIERWVRGYLTRKRLDALRAFLRAEMEAAAAARAAEEAAAAQLAAEAAEAEAAAARTAAMRQPASAYATIGGRTVRNSVRLSGRDLLLLQSENGAQLNDCDARFAAQRAARQSRFSEGDDVLARQLTAAAERRERMASLLADADGLPRYSRSAAASRLSVVTGRYSMRSESCVCFDNDADLLLQVEGHAAHPPSLQSVGMRASAMQHDMAGGQAQFTSRPRASTAILRPSMVEPADLHLSPCALDDPRQSRLPTCFAQVQHMQPAAGNQKQANAASTWPWMVHGHPAPYESLPAPEALQWSVPEADPYPGSMLRRVRWCAAAEAKQSAPWRKHEASEQQSEASKVIAPQTRRACVHVAVPRTQGSGHHGAGNTMLGVSARSCTSPATTRCQTADTGSCRARTKVAALEQAYDSITRSVTAPSAPARGTRPCALRRHMASRANAAAAQLQAAETGSLQHIASSLSRGQHGPDSTQMASLLEQAPGLKSLLGLQQMQHRACTASAAVHRVPCSASHAAQPLIIQQVQSGGHCACCTLGLPAVVSELDKGQTTTLQSWWHSPSTPRPCKDAGAPVASLAIHSVQEACKRHAPGLNSPLNNASRSAGVDTYDWQQAEQAAGAHHLFNL